MATANDMISRALRLIGVLGQGRRTLDATEASDGLDALNTMMDSWSIDRSMIFQLLTQTHTLTAGTADYSIGTGGTINTTRPVKIDQAFIRDNANYDYPVEIINKTAYDSIALKSTRTRSRYLYYDEIYPLAFIRLIYTPSNSTDVLHFTSWKQLQQFSLGTTELDLPPGYQRAIEFNLALELQPEYPGSLIDPRTAQIAQKSLANIIQINQKAPVLNVSEAALTSTGRSRMSIFTG
jgi:hypothetical protein